MSIAVIVDIKKSFMSMCFVDKRSPAPLDQVSNAYFLPVVHPSEVVVAEVVQPILVVSNKRGLLPSFPKRNNPVTSICSDN